MISELKNLRKSRWRSSLPSPVPLPEPEKPRTSPPGLLHQAPLKRPDCAWTVRIGGGSWTSRSYLPSYGVTKSSFGRQAFTPPMPSRPINPNSYFDAALKLRTTNCSPERGKRQTPRLASWVRCKNFGRGRENMSPTLIPLNMHIQFHRSVDVQHARGDCPI